MKIHEGISLLLKHNEDNGSYPYDGDDEDNGSYRELSN